MSGKRGSARADRGEPFLIGWTFPDNLKHEKPATLQLVLCHPFKPICVLAYASNAATLLRFETCGINRLSLPLPLHLAQPRALPLERLVSMGIASKFPPAEPAEPTGFHIEQLQVHEGEEIERAGYSINCPSLVAGFAMVMAFRGELGALCLFGFRPREN